MDDRTNSRILDQIAGDGWLLSSGVRLGPVTYAIDIHEVRTSLGDTALAGTDTRVRLMNHSIDAARWHGHVLTLQLYDGREIAGFISDDGLQLVRTGALV